MSNELYTLGIDGGGSKTVARICRLSDGQQAEFKSGPSSLTNNLESAIATVCGIIDQSLTHMNARPECVHLVLGLAGAGSSARVRRLVNVLAVDFASIQIDTDATTSVYGANLGDPVCLLALGTGSVAARIDEQGIETIQGGWGFVAGDEGSGGKLGLMAVRQLMDELDRYGQPRSMLARTIAKVAGLNRADVLAWVVEVGPVDYARLSPEVFALAGRCEQADAVLATHVSHVEQMIDKIRGEKPLPVVVLGGLAGQTIPLLNPQYGQLIQAPKGDSLDGACWLARRNAQALNK